MNVVTVLLTLAISLLQAVVANPGDPGNAQRIHFAQEAFELSQNYDSISPSSPMTDPNVGAANSNPSPAVSTPAQVVQTSPSGPTFQGVPTVTKISPNKYEFSWQTDVPAAGEVWLFASPGQQQAFKNGDYRGGIKQGDTDSATSTKFSLEVGGNFPYAIVATANGQMTVATGTLPQ